MPPIDAFRYFCNSRIIEPMRSVRPSEQSDVTRYANMFAALGTEPRLRIMRTLLAAHPEGMVVGEIQSELGIAPSTLSHHLEKLKNEDLITVRRESNFLRYRANTAALEELLGFLYAECCTRNHAIEPQKIVQACSERKKRWS